MRHLRQSTRKKNIGWTLFFSCFVVLLFVMLRFVTPMYAIGSGSMTPTLPIGSLVVTAPDSSLQKGDIITFRHAGKVITHTYLGMKDGHLVTHGDANPTVDAFDPPLQKSDVIGKVVVGLTPFRLALVVFVVLCLVVFWPKDKKNTNTDMTMDQQPVPE